ncbi:hypothetical protein N9Z70_05520 [Mariniblastus sp.]|nr:hypothetical protein [Mariniblastus sp.]MDB4380830.1 hypothetical protein [Mariniblastus sp.]
MAFHLVCGRLNPAFGQERFKFLDTEIADPNISTKPRIDAGFEGSPGIDYRHLLEPDKILRLFRPVHVGSKNDRPMNHEQIEIFQFQICQRRLQRTFDQIWSVAITPEFRSDPDVGPLDILLLEDGLKRGTYIGFV